VRHARRTRGLGRVAIRFGDCSPQAVVDDTGLDRLRSAVGDGVDEVSSTWFGENLGSAGGSNALARVGDEHRIWVLNPDTYPSPGCLAALLEALDDGASAADGRQIPIEHPKEYDPATGDTSWVSGSCMMLDRSGFDSVGGFDDQVFPMYCDDVDLSWRLRLAGHRIVHAPAAVVFHDKRPDADGGVRWSAFEARSSTLGRLWLYRRYGRRDLERSLIADLERSESAERRSLLAEYRDRLSRGEAPEPLPSADTIDWFVDGQYAPRRFEYRS